MALRAAAVAATAQIAALATSLDASPLTLSKYFNASMEPAESSGNPPHVCLQAAAY